MWKIFSQIDLIKFFFLSFILLLNACSLKHYKHSNSKILTIKSPQLKFSDLAFIRHSGDAVEAELFIAGKPIKKIAINYIVCVDEGCMSRSKFNTHFLNVAYPDTLLQNVLLGKPIYDGKNRVKHKDGYEQHIKSKDVDILYRVKVSSIKFKDRKNRILIKIKEIK